MGKVYIFTALSCFYLAGYCKLDQGVITAVTSTSLNGYSNTDTIADCSSSDRGTLTVKGHNVKFSDFIEANGKLRNLCPKMGKISKLNVYVSNSLFIDMDFQAVGEELQVTVGAPAWHVLGNRVINLTGLEKPLSRNTAKRGENGLPGNSGGPGGSFFGIGDLFYNGKNLNITVNGGDGGNGQNGGDGFEPFFRYPSDSYLSSSTEELLKYFKSCVDQKNINQKHLLKDNYGKMTLFKCFVELPIVRFEPAYEYSNNECGRAGGRAGKGGNPGSILIVELSFPSLITQIKHPGKKGKSDGRKGSLTNYRPLNKALIITVDIAHFGVQGPEYKEQTQMSNLRCQSYIKKGMDATDPKKPKPLLPYKELNKYKTYLRECSKDLNTTKPLVHFYNSIDSNINVTNMYNTTGLIDELKGIEAHFHELNEDVDLSPYYNSLLNRISQYVDKHYEFLNIQNKKVLAYAYSAILGKLFYLRKFSKSVLVTDIGSYLLLTKDKFYELKSLKGMDSRLSNIKELKDKYNELVYKHIVEARNVVEKDIMPDILKINETFRDPFDSLSNQIREYEKALKEDKENVITYKRNLKEALMGNIFMDVLSFAGSVVSIFGGPEGILAGSAMVSMSSVGKMAINKDIGTLPGETKLPDAISRLGNSIKHIQNQEAARLNKQLNYVLEFTKKYPQSLSELSIKLVSIQDNIKKTNTLCDIKALEKELIGFLKLEYKKLNNNSDISPQGESNAVILRAGSKSEQSDDELREIKGRLRLFADNTGSVVTNVVQDVIQYTKNVESANDLISEITEKQKKLKKYEEAVYDVYGPLLDGMAKTIVDVSQNLENLSQIALIFTNFKIKETLESTTKYIVEFTEGFEAQEMFVDIFKKIQGTFGLLISVYEQIKNYVNELNIANYMADLTSAAANDIKMTDSYLAQEATDLAILIRSNLVLMYYKSAITAFQQFVFPFSNEYTQEFALPKSLKFEKNLTDFVFWADYQINHLLTMLNLYKSTVRNAEGKVHTCSFNSLHPLTKPFFIWQNDRHRDMISKLLSGEEVVVYADIRESDPSKDAIKFNEIAVYLKSANQTAQSIIDKCLETRKITLVHLGSSYYSFAQENGEPIDKSETYDKIKQGDYMLSPYTLWKLQISNSNGETSFDDLKVFANETNVELGGKGKYVDNEVKDLKGDICYRSLRTF